MKFQSIFSLLLAAFVGSLASQAQTGPFSPEDWPATKQATKKVHYVITDDNLQPPGATWLANELTILSGGDQGTANITIGGHKGKKVTGGFLNIADASYGEWADDDFIDILVQVYGDAALFNAQGAPRDFKFLTGTLPELAFPVGGQIPVEARNQKWNWVLFRIPNGIRASNGSHLVGSIPPNAQGATAAGGVNGGTIRFEGVANLIVRAVAFGEEGAFGEPEDINKFFLAGQCEPEPNTNLAGLDLAAGVTNHLVVINDANQPAAFAANIGPANDQRKAVRANGADNYLNFGITGNYLGQACNDPHTIKVCLDYYDDPAFAGQEVTFGPDSYATDNAGGVGDVAADQRPTLEGTGAWVRRSWVIPAVNLKGINAGAFTAGPRFVSANAQVFVSRVELAVLRTGTHPLAGLDPLADCFSDPRVCTDLWGNMAELDLDKGIMDGLDVGTSGGDQEMIQDVAGPANDRRQAIRPARDDGSAGATHQYLNFAILEERFGPSSQPNADFVICVTYYDDPALAGKRFKPEVYMTEKNGTTTFGFTPDSFFVTLEGTDKWRTAYWEITDMKFNGVNQGPQAAARFTLEDKIFFTSVRYGIIRPCGPKAGENPLADCKPVAIPALGVAVGTDHGLVISWPTAATGYVLESTADLGAPNWQPVATAPTAEGDQQVLRIKPGGTTYYRLHLP